MGYALMMASCVRCEAVFGFNPHKVPSIRLTPDAEKQPICKTCVEWANQEKKKLGLPQFTIPEGAYEPINEEEL